MSIDDDPVSGEGAATPMGNGVGFSLEVTFGSARFAATGPGDLVLNAYSAFMNRLPAVSGTSAEMAEDEVAERDTSAPPAQERSEAPSTPKDTPPLPQFMRAHKTKNNQGRALVMAVWAKRHKGMKQFTVEELLTHWRVSGQKLPMRPARDVGLAVSEGWLERLPDDRYQVTSYGERFADEDMAVEGK